MTSSVGLLPLCVGAVVGYLVVMRTNPARGSFDCGWLCVRRYPQLALIPAVFGVGHAGFGLWLRLRPEGKPVDGAAILLPWHEWNPPGWTDVLAGSVLPATESTAALFNSTINTFPLSALGAGLFLCNWRGCQAVIWRGLRRRFSRPAGFAIHGLFAACALAAICKPAVYYFLPAATAQVNEATVMRVGELVDTGSFFFEYLLGVAVQIYLLLLAFAWLRGLTFSFAGLRRLAMRRLGSVVKWAGIVLLLSSLGFNLPLLWSSFHPGLVTGDRSGLFTEVRWGISVVLLCFCSMQILLTLHNETLGHAFRESLTLWRLHGWRLAWLLLITAFHFLLLAATGDFVVRSVGPSTWAAASWTLLVYPMIWSGLAGWFLASWVSLFRSCETRSFEGARSAILSA